MKENLRRISSKSPYSLSLRLHGLRLLQLAHSTRLPLYPEVPYLKPKLKINISGSSTFNEENKFEKENLRRIHPTALTLIEFTCFNCPMATRPNTPVLLQLSALCHTLHYFLPVHGNIRSSLDLVCDATVPPNPFNKLPTTVLVRFNPLRHPESTTCTACFFVSRQSTVSKTLLPFHKTFLMLIKR